MTAWECQVCGQRAPAGDPLCETCGGGDQTAQDQEVLP